MMRTLALISGYLVMTTIGAVALGTLLYLVRDELSARRTRRYYRERALMARATRELQRRWGIEDRVGRPARSWVWPENYTSIEGLLSDLADGGKALMETEREK